MTTIHRKDDLFSEDQRRLILDKIIIYFQNERAEKIGIITAEEILKSFVEIFGDLIYNKALDDVRPLLEKNLETTLIDIEGNLRKEVKK